MVYTDFFGLAYADYAGKRVLDIGCGPRGSLNWADNAAERVGLDPLADAYAGEFGVDEHPMSYLQGAAEAIPFPDEYFDVVASFNSLDHVDDVHAAAAEMTRVLARSGKLLLITELNHDPRWTEPQDFSFEVLEAFSPPLEVVDERRLAKTDPRIYVSVENDVAWDPVSEAAEEAVLLACLEKPAGST